MHIMLCLGGVKICSVSKPLRYIGPGWLALCYARWSAV